jgi:gamma-glutamyltranspeptidase/glutathione hydrolase
MLCVELGLWLWCGLGVVTETVRSLAGRYAMSKLRIQMTSLLALGLCCLVGPAYAQGLSPAHWNSAERERAEKEESRGWTPREARVISGKNGIICAVASPIAVQAGIEALRHGGTAADAATTVALTEVTTQLGSVVSFAGIMTLVYFDAKTGKVYSMDAGYQSYRNERDPKTIPVADMGPLNATFKAFREAQAGVDPKLASTTKGRETLVPGFMAGIEAMHKRFGKLPFGELIEPAIYYAEHGVTINSTLAGFFTLRKPFFVRTPEGKRFLQQAGNELPQVGNRFKQPDLVATLRGVAKEGAAFMYTGDWGQQFVKTIQREGGKVVPEDMQSYQVIWTEPLSTEFFGKRVYTAGLPSQSAYNILPALNLAEEFKLDARPPYWKATEVLFDMHRIIDAVNNAPHLDPSLMARLRAQGIDASPAAQLTKAYAKSLKPLLGKSPSTSPEPRHSNSLVVMDAEGNVAAVTHTINSVIWGDTGIVVGGIPIPDSAGFQQERLAMVKAGARLPNEMMQTIVMAGSRPVLATAGIGSSMIPETIKLVVCAAGQGLSLAEVQGAPALLANFTPPAGAGASRSLTIPVTEGDYRPDFLKSLEAGGVKLTRTPVATSRGLRGTVAAIKIDPATGERTTVETVGVLLFGGAQ